MYIISNSIGNFCPALYTGIFLMFVTKCRGYELSRTFCWLAFDRVHSFLQWMRPAASDCLLTFQVWEWNRPCISLIVFFLSLVMRHLTWSILLWYDTTYDMVWYVIWYRIWYNMIRYMIWYDMIWYDMIWYDMIWYDMIWYDMIWYDMIWYDMIW